MIPSSSFIDRKNLFNKGVPCRLGHDTKHFNVGQYRRVQKSAAEVQDASFFDPNNEVPLPAQHLFIACEDC